MKNKNKINKFCSILLKHSTDQQFFNPEPVLLVLQNSLLRLFKPCKTVVSSSCLIMATGMGFSGKVNM